MIVFIILALIGICFVCMLIIDAILPIYNQPNYAKMAIGDKEYSKLVNTIIDNGELCIDKSTARELVYSCNGTTFYINLNPYSFGNKIIKYNEIIHGEPDRKTMYKLYQINKAIETQRRQDIIDSIKSSIQ